MHFKKTQSVVGGVNNDTGIGFSHSMFALSPHSRVTQQLPGTGEDGLCKCLYILELLNCYLRWIGTDQVSVLTASSGVRRDLGNPCLSCWRLNFVWQRALIPAKPKLRWDEGLFAC